LYCFFKQEHIIESIIVFSGSSSAQPNISGENLEKINMPYDKALIDKFSTLILPLFQQMINIVNQNQNLIKQRDMLLPRLMSGKLEVN
jgi:type I restriction enzyme S subunit